MATTMCNNHSTLKYFWAEAISIPYELWKGRKPIISYFHPFGCNVSSKIPRITLETLTLNVILESYLDTLNCARNIECTTLEP